jgi:hypothetical protein
MRFNFRLKFAHLTFFAMIAKTQTLEGVTSLQSDGSHIVMWDLEKCTLQEAEKTLTEVQRIYGLSHIYVVSDVDGSYRAWCFSKVDLTTFLHILLDTDHLDTNFFYYTVKRQKATLRTGNKKGRLAQEVVSVLKSYPVQIPSESHVEKVIYDTGLEKRGISLLIGDD